MLEDRFPKCSSYYYGWALMSPEQQECERCKTRLVVSQEASYPRYSKPPLINKDDKPNSPFYYPPSSEHRTGL